MHVHLTKVYGHLKTEYREGTYVVSSQILIRMKSATTIEEQIQKLRDRGMVLKGDQGDLFSSLRGVLLVIQYFLFYLPGNRGTQFAIDVKNLMHRYRKDDIVDIVGYLNDVPWLKERL